MKNIPIFTGEYGVATLILEEIPYKRCGYILPQSWDGKYLKEFLTECTFFCKLAGAQQVYVRMETPIDYLPLTMEMYAMRLEKKDAMFSEDSLVLHPLSVDNEKIFLEIYETAFAASFNAPTYTTRDTERLRGEGESYVGYWNNQPVGIGELGGDTLRIVAVGEPSQGWGEKMTRHLLDKIPYPVVKLQVASTNAVGRRLYEKLGFEHTKILKYWYQLL